MAIGPLMDISKLSIESLYQLYLQIAEADHQFRIDSQYGMTPPPAGHCEFRPLTLVEFAGKVRHHDQLGGTIGIALRGRLARQAAAHGIQTIQHSNVASRAA